MITAHYRPDGSVETVTVDYFLLDPQAREDMLAWVRAHGIDPGRVRTPAEIGYDPVTDEWSFGLFVRGPNGRTRVDLATGDVLMRRVRRRAVRDLHWMTTETSAPRGLPNTADLSSDHLTHDNKPGGGR